MMKVGLVIAYIVFAPILGALLDGLDRVVSARMQRRKGPSILQPFYDLGKLFSKQLLAVNNVQLLLNLINLIIQWRLPGDDVHTVINNRHLHGRIDPQLFNLAQCCPQFILVQVIKEVRYRVIAMLSKITSRQQVQGLVALMNKVEASGCRYVRPNLLTMQHIVQKHLFC